MPRTLLIAACVLAFCASAGAQPPKMAPTAGAAGAREALKGRVKPGLYETTVESDAGNMAGVAADKRKQTQTSQYCITAQDIDKGVDDDPNCPVKAFASSGNQLSYSSLCSDGAATDTRMTFTSSGYVAEMKVSGMHKGKPFSTTQKMTARRLGDCKK
jgi:hypothetical protein